MHVLFKDEVLISTEKENKMKTKPSGAKVCTIIQTIFLFKIDEKILW